jgi:hypothetical protein
LSASPAPFTHLDALTDDVGIFEHAELAAPRREYGYCTDDAARLLVVACREAVQTPTTRRLIRVALRFVVESQGHDGRVRNRMNARHRWEDKRSSADWWGRSVWGLGHAVGSSDDFIAQTAYHCFARGAQQRSPWLRSMAFAALGAAEVLANVDSDAPARGLLAASADTILAAGKRSGSPWPEARLAYANAVIPDALIAAGSLLGREDALERGLELLAWLLDRELVDGRLSLTPTGGAGLDERGPRFDQQPIEASSLADACERAAKVDGHSRWTEAVAAAAAWFEGDNDSGARMWDPETGGGYDGLRVDGVNLNQGAESTLAFVSTLQCRHRLSMVGS